MLYNPRRVKLLKNACESRSKRLPPLRRHSLASPLSSKLDGGSPPLLLETNDLLKDRCLVLTKPNLRIPPSSTTGTKSTAAYIVEGDVKVHSAGYVYDPEHYGKGINDLAIIMREFGFGSIATGIGFAWAKFITFASDWDYNDILTPTINIEHTDKAVIVIWTGYHNH